MNTALVLLPPQDRADLVPPPIEFLPISYSPFRFTSLSYPRYPAANNWYQIPLVPRHPAVLLFFYRSPDSTKSRRHGVLGPRRRVSFRSRRPSLAYRLPVGDDPAYRRLAIPTPATTQFALLRIVDRV